MTLQEKLTNEIVEFRKSYEVKGVAQTYKDWYMIGFKEEYYEMLMCDYLDDDCYKDMLEWLCEFKYPLQFLYDEWLSADGAYNHDWDAMVDFIEEVYKEDCIANRQKEEV